MDSLFWAGSGTGLAEKYGRLADFQKKILGFGFADF